ncbi:sigma-54-dependent Fis family transcriptional regulator [Ampullimonas aquatilis]|uniref:sigma-54-dependent Fis family transcriptional regulator n=1 Tax=Ampullimonas aquatilis TaxID=1341549 RepID=UPI003C7638DF
MTDSSLTLKNPDQIISAETEHARIIGQSHQRSLINGLTENAIVDNEPIAKHQLHGLIEQNRLLYQHALPVMETLYEQIINTQSMVLLTDADGMIMHSIGDTDIIEHAKRVALSPGVSWAEETKGTNAIGTAIYTQLPTLVHGEEHFLMANRSITCSACPIIDATGNQIGVLDVTGDYRTYHKHTMALVRMSAQMIENQMIVNSFADLVKIHFHTRPEFIGTLMEGIAVFSPTGKFVAGNRACMFQLGLTLSALRTHTIGSLFGLTIPALYDHYRTINPGLLSMSLHNGVKAYGKAIVKNNPSFPSHSGEVIRPDQQSLTQENQTSKVSEENNNISPSINYQQNERSVARLSSLRYLNTGDPKLAELILRVGKVLGRDIPILITGETGTGKDLLAQAIHNDSPRAKAPFVALNCASIPENLIESELFGYEDGAFTGARKKGTVGKIIQANGGTLFLDEIGDMPLNLQVRLLRVLQERVVTPLGSTKSIPVNVMVICATHRNLHNMIEQKSFREDLYYRLNGLVVKLPPLRERTDLDVVTEKILAQESAGHGRFTIASEVMDLFRQHSWPGNFRQLANLLRTAIVMTDEDHVIRIEHLPEDFMETLRQIRSTQESSQTISSEPLQTLAPIINQSHTTGHIPPDNMGKLEDLEVQAIQKALQAHHGNVSAAARALGISRNTIYRKLQ